MSSVLRLGTRRSPLAQAQTDWVAQRLKQAHPDCRIETIWITTSGDRRSADPNATVNPDENLKALFTKELEEALLDGRIDLAIHSLKDMSTLLPAGLTLAAVPEREDPRDVWISKNGSAWSDIPAGALVGTGAVRRQIQLEHLRPDIHVVPMRGNVDTRLKKLREGDLQGIVLALAGLRRLQRDAELTEIFSTQDMLPAVGQGCLAIETRGDDAVVHALVSALDHPPSHAAARAERAFLLALGGSCQTPIAAYAQAQGEQLRLDGLIQAKKGIVRQQRSGPIRDPETIGQTLATELLQAGGGFAL